MRVDIITIFPQMFSDVFGSGMPRQAVNKGLLELRIIDLRAFADDRRRTIDDRPYGGGDGMVLKPEPLFLAVEQCMVSGAPRPHVVFLSPQGATLTQSKSTELSLLPHLVLICGRYEGVDQRVIDHLVDEEVSIGDFVLSGGEFAAMVLVDAVARLIPGVVGKGGSVLEESFMDGLLDCPHYTRPEEFRGWRVPEVLTSGDHAEIERWRNEQAMKLTRDRRPDLLATEDTEKSASTESTEKSREHTENTEKSS